MPSLRSTFLAAAAALAAVAGAQQLRVEPSSVPMATRKAWCTDQTNTCPLICQQMEPRTTLTNSCDPKTLQYGCLCGNNQRPNVSEFTLTLPYFICQEWGNQCVKGCKSDNQCAADCREKHPCGATEPKKFNTTGVIKPAATQTDDGTTIYTDGPGSSSTDSKGAGVTLEVGRTYGMAIVLTGLFAGFALL